MLSRGSADVRYHHSATEGAVSSTTTFEERRAGAESTLTANSAMAALWRASRDATSRVTEVAFQRVLPAPLTLPSRQGRLQALEMLLRMVDQSLLDELLKTRRAAIRCSQSGSLQICLLQAFH